jgi:hypothetical protein
MADEPTNPNPDETKKVGEGEEPGQTGEEEPKEPSRDDLKTQLEAVTKERDTFKDKAEHNAKKLGKQSHEVKLLNELTSLAKEQPREYVRKVAEKAGLGKVYFEEDKPAEKVGLDLDGIDDDKLKALDAMRVKGQQDLRREVHDVVSPLIQNMVAGRYPDWEDLASIRENVAVGRQRGIIQDAELDHLVARGLNMAAALNDAEERGKAKYIASLQNKEGEHIPGSGAEEAVDKKLAILDFAQVAKEMNASRV